MQSILQYRSMGQYLRTRVSELGLGEDSSEKLDPSLLSKLGVRTESVPNMGDRHIVGFEECRDPYNPQDWSIGRKWATTATVGMTGFLVGWASAIDSEVVPQAMKEFQVTEVLATALYLVAFGLGSLFSGPLSETLGRNPVYIASLIIFMVWVMAAALAPNIGAQLVFRFLAGFFGCTPLTTFGGSTSDMWSFLDRTYVFPVMACLSFIGPFLAPMVGAFIGQSPVISWRWTEWVTLILAALIVSAIAVLVPETYPPVILEWKAKHLRTILGNEKFTTEHSLHDVSFATKMRQNITRPFELFFTQIIVVLWCCYLSLIYIILFTFLPGYDYVFGETYGFGQGSTGLMFIGLNVGFLVALAICPFIYNRYAVKTKQLDGNVPPEERLVYAMIAAPWVPISLFWMAWTARPEVTFWSPLIASVAFGFAMQGIFISAYLYLIDTFERFAASALVSLTLTRYIGAGAMTIAANPMYKGIHVEWTLTLLGCLGLLFTPVPFAFYRWGGKVRAKSVPRD